MSVGIVGAGAFGTALAIAIAARHPVTLWARTQDAADQMRQTRQSPRLPGVVLPDQITPSADVTDLSDADVVLLAVPMQQLRGVLAQHGATLAARPLVACCKGVELHTGLGPVDVINDVLSGVTCALLTGPSFADDIARGLPTALTLAHAHDGRWLQDHLSTPVLRLYRSTDLVGAQLGGALKNVIAIACGAAIGAGLGESARAALMTRGYAEMQRFAQMQGAQPETLAGLSGFGDLVLTAMSEQSRNCRLGLALGRGAAFDASVTVEGAATARAVAAVAERSTIDMPITGAVVALLDQSHTVKEVMAALLARPLKEE